MLKYLTILSWVGHDLVIKQQQKPKEPVVIIKEFPLAVTLVSIQQAHFFTERRESGQVSWVNKAICSKTFIIASY